MPRWVNVCDRDTLSRVRDASVTPCASMHIARSVSKTNPLRFKEDKCGRRARQPETASSDTKLHHFKFSVVKLVVRLSPSTVSSVTAEQPSKLSERSRPKLHASNSSPGPILVCHDKSRAVSVGFWCTRPPICIARLGWVNGRIDSAVRVSLCVYVVYM